MNRAAQENFFYFVAAILFMQTIVSVLLFSQLNADGGYWPFVLVIFSAVNSIYSLFVLWLIRSYQVGVFHAALSTLALSVSIFLLSNFGWLFGLEGHRVATKLGLGIVLGSDITPYSLYVLFAVLPMLVKRRPT